MKSRQKLFAFILLSLITFGKVCGQDSQNIISNDDLKFLHSLTADVFDSSKVVSKGQTLITPGGRNCYPAFWIRDYAMSLDCGLISKKEQTDMLNLTASTQCVQTWITKNGSMVPFGAIADHILIDNHNPIYFPGTYDYEEQGSDPWGKFPPYTDQYCFIHMVYTYVKSFHDAKILKSDINGYMLKERLEWAFKVPPAHLDTHIVYTTEYFRGVDFGFRDAIKIYGDLSITSVFKYKAAIEMSYLFKLIGEKDKTELYSDIAAKLKKNIPNTFINSRGLLMAGTEYSKQGDVWSTALAVYWNLLEGKDREKACQALANGYKNNLLSYKGNIRHVLTDDDYDSRNAWEGGNGGKGTYQNGAYWSTPVGWICYAISQVDNKAAMQLAKEYINELREDDFRKGGHYGAPYECLSRSYTRNPIYLTSVSSPLAVFLNLKNKQCIH
jgi:hypothetical protein